MLTKIQKWGNSQGLRLTKQVLQTVQIEVGEDVEVSTRDGVIEVRPLRRIRGKYTIEELVAGIPKGRHIEEVDWGNPLGKESW